MRLICLTICLWLGRPIAGSGQAALQQQMATYMQAQHDINHFAGVVLITRHDTVLLRQAYGLADAEWSVPNIVESKFAVASITKQFTAVAILQLAQRGQVRLTDKLSAFLPGFSNGNAITLHMLLTHTSGLALDYEELYLDRTAVSKDSALAFIRRLPMQFTPGQKVGYSNVGYFLLGQIIEKVSGLPYGEYLQRNILQVAKMTDTGLNSNTALVPKLARIYCREGESFFKNPYINWDLNIGHDGLYSTADDLAKFDHALRGTALLSVASKALMNTQHNKSFGGNGFFDHYGYGVFVDPYFNHGHHELTHSGGYFGATSTLDRYPQDEVFITVMSNNESGSHWISYGLAGILFGKGVEVPYTHRPVAIDATSLPHYAGQYGAFVIGHANGELYLDKIENPLVPESGHKFYQKSTPDRTYEFLTGKNGKAYAVVLTKGGVKETILKQKAARRR